MRPVILALILLCSVAGWGACPGDGVCLQQAANDATFASTLNITITSASAGQCIHLLTAIDFGQTITSITGTTNVTWTAVKSMTGPYGSGTAEFKWWKGTVTGATGTTVTLNASVVPFGIEGSLAVFATSCTIDATTPVTNSQVISNCPPSTDCATPVNASFTNTNASDVIFTGMIQNAASTNTATTPAGYTALTAAGAAASFSIQPAYKVVSAAASQSAPWSLTFANNWGTMMGGDAISAGGGAMNNPKGWVF